MPGEKITWMPLGEPTATGRPLTTQRLEFTSVPVFPPADPRHNLSSGPIGSPGTYAINYALAVPGTQVAQIAANFDALESSADSLLSVSTGDSELIFTIEPDESEDIGHVVVASINAENRLATLRHDLEAENFHSAARTSYDLIMPILCRWSFDHNAPITVAGVELLEVSTDARKVIATFVGAVKNFTTSSYECSREAKHALAAYREGLSSSEPLYQALSFFKVIEMVFYVRAAERNQARKDQLPNLHPSEKFPNTADFLHPFDRQMYGNNFEPFLGKKFTTVRDDLKGSLRNSIAHLDPGRDPFGIDTYDDLVTVESNLPALRYMARVLLASILDPSTTEENP